MSIIVRLSHLFPLIAKDQRLHKLCAKHILTNWQKRHPGDRLKFLFWKCANSYCQREFIEALDNIGQYPNSAKEHLIMNDPKHWPKAFSSKEVKCDNNTNNIENGAEVVLKARKKPIYSLYEDPSRYLMVRYHEKRTWGLRWKNDIGH